MLCAVEHSLFGGVGVVVAFEPNPSFRRPELFIRHGIAGSRKLTSENGIHARCREPFVLTDVEGSCLGVLGKTDGRAQVACDRCTGAEESGRLPSACATCAEQVSGRPKKRLLVAEHKRSGETHRAQVVRAVAENLADLRRPASMSGPTVCPRKRGAECSDNRRWMREETDCQRLPAVRVPP